MTTLPPKDKPTDAGDRTAWLIEMESDCLSRGSIAWFGIHYWHPTKGFSHEIDEALQFARQQDAEAFKREFKLSGKVVEHMWPAARTPITSEGEGDDLREARERLLEDLERQTPMEEAIEVYADDLRTVLAALTAKPNREALVVALEAARQTIERGIEDGSFGSMPLSANVALNKVENAITALAERGERRG